MVEFSGSVFKIFKKHIILHGVDVSASLLELVHPDNWPTTMRSTVAYEQGSIQYRNAAFVNGILDKKILVLALENKCPIDFSASLHEVLYCHSSTTDQTLCLRS